MTAPPSLSGLLISSFNLGNFSRILSSDSGTPAVTCTLAPFGQVMPVLLAPVAGPRPDFAVVWVGPEHVSAAFAESLETGAGDLARALADVDAFSAAVRQFATGISHVFVPTWVRTGQLPRSALRAMTAGGSGSLLVEMNARLAASLRDLPNVHVLDASAWLEGVDGARDPKLWYLAKVPFTNEVFLAAVRDIKAALRGLTGKARRLLVVDLDDTLWGGLVGDVGWQKLRVGGHDPIGEAYVDFQRGLRTLARRGIVLAIVSKNEADVALEAIDRHPEMLLRRADFAGWRINRLDKARNLVELVNELRLGLDAAVFIDDSPAERARVREALPDVLVPDWPTDPLLYGRALASLPCFDLPPATDEDVRRTAMYSSERDRAELLAQVGSVDDWLRTLDSRVTAEAVGDRNVTRVLQLLNKTNQMNLATRRLTEGELRTWLSGGGRKAWCFRVTDRLGDSGITGVLSAEVCGQTLDVRDFLLSCRVMGRKVEETMFHVAVDHARMHGLREVRLAFVPTARNAPCREFLDRVGFPRREGDVYVWPADHDYRVPESVTFVADAVKETV